jgi:vancomycin permeability regulator SanA
LIAADHAAFDTDDSCMRARKIVGVRRAIVVTQAAVTAAWDVVTRPGPAQLGPHEPGVERAVRTP